MHAELTASRVIQRRCDVALALLICRAVIIIARNRAVTFSAGQCPRKLCPLTGPLVNDGTGVIRIVSVAHARAYNVVHELHAEIAFGGCFVKTIAQHAHFGIGCVITRRTVGHTRGGCISTRRRILRAVRR